MCFLSRYSSIDSTCRGQIEWKQISPVLDNKVNVSYTIQETFILAPGWTCQTWKLSQLGCSTVVCRKRTESCPTWLLSCDLLGMVWHGPYSPWVWEMPSASMQSRFSTEDCWPGAPNLRLFLAVSSKFSPLDSDPGRQSPGLRSCFPSWGPSLSHYLPV